jgi:hypothetical protein
MKEKYSIASRNRWQIIPENIRKQKMSDLAKLRWKNVSKEKRKEISLSLVKAKHAKRNLTK